MKQISTEQLIEQSENADVKVLDVRSVDAYNGWPLEHQARGGHIRNAKSLPFKWLRYIDWIEIVRAKGLKPQDRLVVYSDRPDQSRKVAEQFHRAEFEHIEVYDHFVDEWCADEALPMDQLPRYDTLVSADWLQTLIHSGRAPTYENDSYVLCHAHYRNRQDYDEGHIPGAVEVDTMTLESPETWNRRCAEELKAALESLGITCKTTVVLYGRFSYPDRNDPFPGSSAGQLAAMRCALIMLYAGVRDVRILNGGLQSWRDAGFALTTEPVGSVAVSDFGASIPGRPELIVDLPEAKAMLKAADKNLISVRSWSEYIGQVSGYNYIAQTGRIPGSVFGNCGSDAYHMENYRNLDHTTREYHEIEALWAAAGITPDKHNAFYCGTGWRGSEAFFNAWLMGWPRVSVFDGGWFEWSNDPTNPIETGIPSTAKHLEQEAVK